MREGSISWGVKPSWAPCQLILTSRSIHILISRWLVVSTYWLVLYIRLVILITCKTITAPLNKQSVAAAQNPTQKNTSQQIYNKSLRQYENSSYDLWSNTQQIEIEGTKEDLKAKMTLMMQLMIEREIRD
jgi:hypothetical protein